jgi:hypothetical protein
MLRARERTPTPFPSTIFIFGLIVESIKELEGASILIILPLIKNNSGLPKQMKLNTTKIESPF